MKWACWHPPSVSFACLPWQSKRGLPRRGANPGATGAIPSAALLLHRTAVIWEGAPMKGVHRSPVETVLLEWEAAAVPGRPKPSKSLGGRRNKKPGTVLIPGRLS